MMPQPSVPPVEELFASHRAKLENFCFRMVGQREAAQDLAQEVFVRAIQSAGPVDVAWLFGVARNACVDHLRRAGGWRKMWEKLCGRPLVTTFDDALVEREAGFRVLRALPPRERALLLLKEYAGLDYQQLAAIFSTTPGSIGVMLHRARQRACQLLEAQPR
ncbi:MAG: sigma-70 family RNA polymerase sigma factor [Candidatus Eremiobacteraeota bacterium]|nr:sigma-70 family RNA polymerase sigma factor [Candidatus Eremiobacteraeota bacterium]